MRTKQQIRESLEEEPLYRSALSGIPEEDKKNIESAVESMIIDLVMQMEEFAELIKADPLAQAELARGLGATNEIVNSTPEVSGSTG